ncbi:MAG: hypothetical protein ABFC62_11025 [Clostridiaceae bacterium]|nr:hypothetical protein [Eubacteriales bacterium]
MESERAFIEDMIDRYVYQASRSMPRAGREDAARELRALIYDMLSERANGLPPTKKQLEAVFVELGSPAELGAKYSNAEGRVLIGKALYPIYIKIVKIVGTAVPFGLAVAKLVETLTGGIAWYFAIVQWLGLTFSALFTALGVITFLFAVFEYKGVKLDGFNTPNGPFDLPPIPKEPERAEGAAGLIASVAFTVLFSLLFAFAPGIFAFYTPDSGFVPLFSLERVHALVPLILLLMAFQVGKEVCRRLEKPRGLRAFFVTTVFSAACLALMLFLFGDGSIWNADFLPAVAAGFGAADPFFGVIWQNVIHYFPFLFVFAFVLETGVNAEKMLRKRAA